jgi:hypothetical protein
MPKPAALPVLSFAMVGAPTTGLPLMLFGDTPDDAETPLGLTARVVRIYARGVGPAFRSPSLLLLAVVSATFTCGSRGRVVGGHTWSEWCSSSPGSQSRQCRFARRWPPLGVAI